MENKLITMDDNSPILTPETRQALVLFEEKLKDLKKQEELLKQKLLEEMEKNKIVKLESPELLITYVGETTRQSFDSKRFKEENPKIYWNYVSESPVKPSVRIKLREKKDE